MAILRLRNALRIRRKSRIGSAPTLDSLWQMRDCFLERRLPLFLRLGRQVLLLHSLARKSFSLFHLAQAISQGILCRHLSGGFGVDRLRWFYIGSNRRRLSRLYWRRCNRGPVFDAVL